MIRVYRLKEWDVVSSGEGEGIAMISNTDSQLLETILDHLVMGSVGRMPSKKHKNGNYMDEFDKQYKTIKFKKIKAPLNEFLAGALE